MSRAFSAADGGAAAPLVRVFFCIYARPPMGAVFIAKGSRQNDVTVPGAVEARLASSPWQLPTQQPRCATQHWQVK